jgi:ligand-binding sensor domain-containing protein
LRPETFYKGIVRLFPMSKIYAKSLILAVLLLASALAGQALEPTTSLANYGRQSWGMENGLPQNTVQALVQTRDGFVWLGTEVGLVRFDGNAFAVFDKNSSPALPGSDVRCLLAARDGALWIGTSEGLARWKNGALAVFTTVNGLPGNGIQAIVEDAAGGLRVETDGGSARLAGGRFTPVADKLQQKRPAAIRRSRSRLEIDHSR